MSRPSACRKPCRPGTEEPALIESALLGACMAGRGSGAATAGGEDCGACASALVLSAAQPARNIARDPTCNIRTGLNIIILMATLYITHPACRLHEMGNWHPESPDRLD